MISSKMMKADQRKQEVDRLRGEISQEKIMKSMIEESYNELKKTVDELEKKLDSVDEEGNEWKTRFETQEEMNLQLQKQIMLLQEKVGKLKLQLEDNPNGEQEVVDDLPEEITPQMIKSLEREKLILEGELTDIDWRIDQESKQFFKANDERKRYNAEISATKYALTDLQTKQRTSVLAQQKSLDKEHVAKSSDATVRPPPAKRISGIPRLAPKSKPKGDGELW